MENGIVGLTSIHAPLHVVVAVKREPTHVPGLVVADHAPVLEVRLVIQSIVVRIIIMVWPSEWYARHIIL